MSFSRSLLLVIWSLLGFLTLASVSAAQDNQTKIFTTRDGLAGDYVTSIAFAHDGSAWIGTTEGATHIEPNHWTSYTRAHGLGDSWTTAIAIAPDDRVWFGTQSGGVSVLDPETKTLTTHNLDNSEIPSNFITAIAVDENNRVWLDTLDKGVAQYDVAQNKWTRTASPMPPAPTTPITWRATPRGLIVTNPPAWLNPPKPYPTVLIHGWTVAGDDTLETSEFRFLKSYADRDGIPVHYVQGVSPKNTLYQNAQVIRDEIARVKLETGADKVNLIGFSMGGMNARAYLETSLYANDVNRAIILGTPQAGVDIWKPILFQQILQKPDEPSTIELSPEYAQQVVNQTRAPNPNVPYDLLIGDARQQAGLEFLDDMPASDALISVNSSLALDAPNVNKHINADLHDWGPQAVPLDLTGYLYPRDTWERYLRNALRNNDNAPIGSEIASPPALQTDVPQSNHTPVITEKIRAGDTVTRTVLIDENKSARFIAYYPGGKMNFSLIAPDGKKYEPTDLPRDEDGVLSLSTDIANFSGYVVKNAPVGIWQMILERTDPSTSSGGSDAIDVSTYVELDSAIRISVNVNPPEPATMGLYTLSAHAPIGSHVTAKLAQFALDFQLYDDGGHDDGAADDGIFAYTAKIAMPGWTLAQVRADGKNFARETEILFPVSYYFGKFDPRVTWRFATAPDSKKETLTIDAQIHDVHSTKMAVVATLRDANKTKIYARQFVPMMFQEGDNDVTLTFDSANLSRGEIHLDLQLLDLRRAAYPLGTISDAAIIQHQ